MSESFHPEKHRNVAGSWYRASVFGVSDGLVTNASLILGFAGANPGHNIVRLAGLAGLVAGGFSMASGEYISVRAQRSYSSTRLTSNAGRSKSRRSKSKKNCANSSSHAVLKRNWRSVSRST